MQQRVAVAPVAVVCSAAGGRSRKQTISAASRIVSTYHSADGARCPASFEPGLGLQTKGTTLAPIPERGSNTLQEGAARLQTHDEDAVNIPRAEDVHGLLDGREELVVRNAPCLAGADAAVERLVPDLHAVPDSADTRVPVTPDVVFVNCRGGQDRAGNLLPAQGGPDRPDYPRDERDLFLVTEAAAGEENVLTIAFGECRAATSPMSWTSFRPSTES